jgi:UDP-glucuronate decarboxylase
MRILVTGGAGLIGSHLCERLLAGGHELSCLDNFSTGARANIAHLEGRPGFALLVHDVTVPFAAEAERIYHLACPASPRHYQRDPVLTARTSVLGTLHALELARATGARLLLASTSEVYGDPAVHPQPESYNGNVNPIGPRACYDESKRLAETLCFDYRRQYGVETKVARIFNTYGPRMRPDDGRVISNFLSRARAGEPLILHGDGSQTRSFCHVDDMVAGLASFMECPAEFAGPVNLGHPCETSMRDLALLVAELTGARAGVIHADRPPDDPARRCPDLSLARARLGFEPRIDLREGLSRTIAALGR